MKSKNFSFIFLILIALGSTFCLGQFRISVAKRTSRWVDKSDSVLSGIGELQVMALKTDSDPNSRISMWNSARLTVEKELKKAGIGISRFTSRTRSSASQLQIYLDTLKVDEQQSIICIRSLLTRPVYLEQRSPRTIDACVWELEPSIQLVDSNAVDDAAIEVVSAHLESFIRAYKSTNKTTSRVTDANDVTTFGGDGRISTATTSAVRSSYVSSSKSRVFHKSDCSFVKRISKENLVGYSSTQEAEAAGKRPCKRCLSQERETRSRSDRNR